VDAALRTAIEYARKGWFVFPLKPKTSFPFKGFKWKEKSTNNEELIKRVGESEKYLGCNWALDCGKSNVFVLDVDCKKGKKGFESLAELPAFESNLSVQTPSGGKHFYFRGAGPTSADKLGDGLDTRGVGGYAVLPGSSDAAGKVYKFLDHPAGEVLFSVPSFISKSLGRAAQKKEDFDIPVCELDQSHHIQNAIRYLSDQAEMAELGSRGITCYRVACRVRDLGVSQLECEQLMLEHYAERCDLDPGFVAGEMLRSIKNAFSYARDRPGNDTPEALFPEVSIKSKSIRCIGDIQPQSIKPRNWILGRRYLPGYVTLTIAPGGVGKSLLTILEALSVLSGKQLTHDAPKQTGAVWLFNAEDPFDELERRIVTALKYHKIPQQSVAHGYFTSGQTHPIKLVLEHRGETSINTKLRDAIIKEIKQRDIKLFILDPFVRCHEVNENDNRGIDLVVQALTYIAAETGCAISIVHHTRKLSKGGSATRGNADSGRGASALKDAARIVHTLYGMDEKEAQEYGVDPVDAKWYVRLDDAKMNLAPPGGYVAWFQKQSIRLNFDDDEDETTGTLKAVQLHAQAKVDIEEVIVGAVTTLVRPGYPKSIYSLARVLVESGELSATIKTAQRAIEKLFSAGLKKLGRTYLVDTVDRGNKFSKLIICETQDT
jgi:RecA-family ATPase